MTEASRFVIPLEGFADAEDTEDVEQLSTVDAMTEIGEIVLRQGTYSSQETVTGILNEHRKTIEIPFADGTVLTAQLAYPATERSLSSNRITLKITGQAPEHYRKLSTTRASVTLHGKPKHEDEHSLGVSVNKVFYPSGKDFEYPKPPSSQREVTWEKLMPKTHFENKDGVDYAFVLAPVSRHGIKTLKFAQDFTNRYLKVFRAYDNLQAPTANMSPQISQVASV